MFVYNMKMFVLSGMKMLLIGSKDVRNLVNNVLLKLKSAKLGKLYVLGSKLLLVPSINLLMTRLSVISIFMDVIYK